MASKFVLFLAVSCAGLSSVAIAQKATNPASKALDAAHTDYLAQLTDEFADVTVARSDFDQPFKIVVPLHSGTETGGVRGPFYVYEAGKLELTFSLDEKSVRAEGLNATRYLVGQIGGNRQLVDQYIGSNAYGANANVKVEKIREDGIAFLTRPSGEIPTYFKNLNMSDDLKAEFSNLDKSYEVEISVTGSEARTMVRDLALEIEGTTRALPSGDLAKCDGFHSAARIDKPTEIYGSTCWIGADISRVAFVNRDTGAIIKEWVR